jgi:two-component system response regulator FlrC
MSEARRILVIDDEPGMRAGLAEVLARGGFTVEVAATGEEGLARLALGGVDLLVTDLRLPGLGGLDVVREARRAGQDLPVVVITAYGTVEDAVTAMKLGAFDFLTKPFSPADLLHLAGRALAPAAAPPGDRDVAGAGRPRGAEGTPPRRRAIVSRDPAVLRVLEIAESVASSRAPVLIEGESGTGKELLARHLHESGARRGRAFVAVNCAALPRELLESELFGHERGAFTGAVARKVGKFELAAGGTILLDEISEMELGLQAKLLRVLQEYEIDRVGGTAPVPVDVRVVATTNRRLRDQVDRGAFREDLYYRLSVIPLALPPLRERPGDIELLAEHFLGRFTGGRRLVLGAAAREALRRHPWPGNVRQLENALERATLLARSSELTPADLGDQDATPRRLTGGALAGRRVRDVERQLIFETLQRTKNNRTQAARLLGISIRTLRNKLAEYRQAGEQDPTAQPGV